MMLERARNRLGKVIHDTGAMYSDHESELPCVEAQRVALAIGCGGAAGARSRGVPTPRRA